MWGRPARASNVPKVKAYVGPLPVGVRGVEFSTDVEPDPSLPPALAFWSGPRDGVDVINECARIKVRVHKNTQV